MEEMSNAYTILAKAYGGKNSEDLRVYGRVVVG
jgi:hypothetical protein